MARNCLAVTLLTLLVGGVASAQPRPGAAPAPSPPSSAAAALSSASAPAPHSPAAAAPPMMINEEARRQFRAGVAFLEDPEGARYEEAYAAFKAAYAASPTPRILGNLGLCAMKLERDGEAIDAYAAYLHQVKDIDYEERVQITRDLNLLRASLVLVAIGVSPGQVTLVDVRVANNGVRVVNTYPLVSGQGQLGLRPGRHEIHLRAQGYQEVTWEREFLPAARVERSVTLAPLTPEPKKEPEAPPRPSLAPPILLSAVGAALLGAGAATGIIALNKTRTIERACPSNVCPASYNLGDARSEARAYVHATDGLLLGGGLVAAAGLTWLGMTLSERSQPAAALRSLPAVGCSTTGCGASWRMSF